MGKWNNFIRMNQIHQQLTNITRMQNELEMPLVVKGMLDQIKAAKDMVRAMNSFGHENLNIMNNQRLTNITRMQNELEMSPVVKGMYDQVKIAKDIARAVGPFGRETMNIMNTQVNEINRLVSSGVLDMVNNVVNQIDYKSIIPMFDSVAVNDIFYSFKSLYSIDTILESIKHVEEKFEPIQYEFIDEIKVLFEAMPYEAGLQRENFHELIKGKVEGFVSKQSEKYSGEELKKVVASVFICLFIVFSKISADVASNIASSFVYAVFEEVYPQAKHKAVGFVRDIFKLVDGGEGRYIVEYVTPIHIRGDANSRKIGKVIPGQIVLRVEKKGKWAMVEYEGHNGDMGGWVLNKYLLPIQRKKVIIGK